MGWIQTDKVKLSGPDGGQLIRKKYDHQSAMGTAISACMDGYLRNHNQIKLARATADACQYKKLEAELTAKEGSIDR